MGAERTQASDGGGRDGESRAVAGWRNQCGAERAENQSIKGKSLFPKVRLSFLFLPLSRVDVSLAGVVI